MTYKFFNLIIIIILSLFVYLILKYYFSKENIAHIQKNRNTHSQYIENKMIDLPVFENDTNNIITFNDGYNTINQKKKRKFWELFN